MTNPIPRQWCPRTRDLEAESRLRAAGIEPVLARIYAARGITAPEQLERRPHALDRPEDLQGVEAAAAILARGITTGRRICVVGDFDCDGATSVALAVWALETMGGTYTTYVVPDRFRFGYGLTPELVGQVVEGSAPDILLTVDNGISSHRGIELARGYGIEVVVTDHHLPPSQLPNADALVNPNQAGCTFPSKGLAGVGVTFYVMAALRSYLRTVGWFTQNRLPEPNLSEALDLVAIGTVADLVPLDHNNRILVYQGLVRIRSGRARPGVQALAEVARCQPAELQASDLGFALAPRLNAAGRLEDMSCGIRCLLASDLETARALARELDQLNEQRRSLEKTMRTAALEQLTQTASLLDEYSGVCLYQPDWHPGVVGLVASRVKEQLHRPVIAFAQEAEGRLKGSGRSIPGVHMRDALTLVATRTEGWLNRFGGHAMAAGLSLNSDYLEPFQRAFDEAVRELATPDAFSPTLATDGPLDPGELTLERAELIASGGPWGVGFPEPLFQGDFHVRHLQVVGEHHLRMWVVPEGGNVTIEAIYFQGAPEGRVPDLQGVELAYRLHINAYRKRRRLQLIVEDCRAHP